MEWSDARDQLVSMTAADLDPVLEAHEVDYVLNEAARVDRDGNDPDTYASWQSAHTYVAGDELVPSPRNDHYYTVTIGGASGNTQPTFPTTSGATVALNGVTYQESGTAAWEPTYDLNWAAAQLWRRKAAKAASRYNVSEDGQSWSRSQIIQQCLSMAQDYANRIHETLSSAPYLPYGRSASRFYVPD